MNQAAIEKSADALRASWEQLKTAKPSLRIRDAAAELGVSEAELLGTTVGDYTTALDGDWGALLQRLPELGRVMSLTRNEGCVLEHKGPFQKVEIMGSPAHKMATVIGPIETRVFFSGWRFGFAVKQPTPHGLQQSLQIFDEAGEAVTKIFLQQEAAGNRQASNQEAYDRIVADFTSPVQISEIKVKPIQSAPTKHLQEIGRAHV